MLPELKAIIVLVGGLILGVGLAFYLERRRKRITNSKN